MLAAVAALAFSLGGCGSEPAKPEAKKVASSTLSAADETLARTAAEKISSAKTLEDSRAAYFKEVGTLPDTRMKSIAAAAYNKRLCSEAAKTKSQVERMQNLGGMVIDQDSRACLINPAGG
jgi:hypothetical protein